MLGQTIITELCLPPASFQVLDGGLCALARALNDGACPNLKALHVRAIGATQVGVLSLAQAISGSEDFKNLQILHVSWDEAGTSVYLLVNCMPVKRTCSGLAHCASWADAPRRACELLDAAESGAQSKGGIICPGPGSIRHALQLACLSPCIFVSLYFRNLHFSR